MVPVQYQKVVVKVKQLPSTSRAFVPVIVTWVRIGDPLYPVIFGYQTVHPSDYTNLTGLGIAWLCTPTPHTFGGITITNKPHYIAFS